MKLIKNSIWLGLCHLFAVSQPFTVSSQNILRINQELINNRRDLRPGDANPKAQKIVTARSEPSITFNNTLPKRFLEDLAPEKVRQNLIGILQRPESNITPDHMGSEIIHKFSSKSLDAEVEDNNSYRDIPGGTKKENISMGAEGRKKRLLLLVKGALSHSKERAHMREYYGDINRHPEKFGVKRSSSDKYEIQIKFLVGRSAFSDLDADDSELGFPTNSNTTTLQFKSDLDQEVLSESRQYNDIIIGDFQDNYENLVLKSLLGLEWYTSLEEKERPEYLMMIDDDVDVKVQELFTLLDNKEEELEREKENLKAMQGNSSPGKSANTAIADGWGVSTAIETPPEAEQNPLLLCPWKNARKARVSRRGPWAVSVKSYPATHWPSYCGGACYLMNYRAAKQLHDSAKKVVAFDVPIEDAFITGVLRERAQFDLESTRPVCVHNYKRESVTGQFVENHKTKAQLL